MDLVQQLFLAGRRRHRAAGALDLGDDEAAVFADLAGTTQTGAGGAEGADFITVTARWNLSRDDSYRDVDSEPRREALRSVPAVAVFKWRWHGCYRIPGHKPWIGVSGGPYGHCEHRRSNWDGSTQPEWHDRLDRDGLQSFRGNGSTRVHGQVDFSAGASFGSGLCGPGPLFWESGYESRHDDF